MIRVGFILEGYDWLGGVNYYRNLLSALALIRDPVVRPVMFVGTKTPEDIVENFYTAEIVRSSVLDLKTPAGFARRVIRKFFSQRDLVLDALLRQHDIQVLSHYSGALSRRTSVKSIGWIPDFQYLHLPAYFTEDDCARREAAVERLIRNCHSLIVSSVVAQDDLAKVSPASISKSNVLHFVPEVDSSPSEITRKDLEIRYKFKAPYFYLPNQFWIHKNHRIVIEALAKLKKEGITPMVLASGATSDHRFPDHFTELLALARREGVDVSFKVLGVIPYEDLLLLMRYSLAVINPSLFEGWSSTVEEAKALDKTVLLSSIPTHKEQSPNKGVYFDPLDAEDLARKMVGIMRNEGASLENAPRCSATYAEDRMNFALNYQEIVSCVFSENTLQGK